MPETIQKGDFIELDYTGKLADGTVFDTTQEKVAKEHQMETEKVTFSPASICVGERQLLPGLDEELAGKELGKGYTITLPPEKAFGKRDIKRLKVMPASAFKEHRMQPYPGLQIEADGEVGTVSSVSGGRIIVNFNHPLAGKEVIYEFIIHKKITEPQEQIKVFLEAGLRIPKEKIEVEIAEGKAKVQVPLQLPAQITDLLGKKLAELTKLQEIVFEKK